jgi:hypothetical protein
MLTMVQKGSFFEPSRRYNWTRCLQIVSTTNNFYMIKKGL